MEASRIEADGPPRSAILAAGIASCDARVAGGIDARSFP